MAVDKTKLVTVGQLTTVLKATLASQSVTVSDEAIETAVSKYLSENPVSVGMTEDEVTAIVNNAISTIGTSEGLTEAEVKTLIDTAIAGISVEGGLSESQVKTIVSTYVEDNKDTLKGDKGDKGDKGENGADGTNGTNGIDGKSAYELAVDSGFSGTMSEWLDSLKGQDGTQGLKGDTLTYDDMTEDQKNDLASRVEVEGADTTEIKNDIEVLADELGLSLETVSTGTTYTSVGDITAGIVYNKDNGSMSNQFFQSLQYTLTGSEKKLRYTGRSASYTAYGYPALLFYNSSNRVMQSVGTDDQTTYTDEIIDVPEGAAMVRVNSNTSVTPKLEIVTEQTGTEAGLSSSYKGKKILYMGDSITALTGERGWTTYANQILSPSLSVNVAVPGARWANYSDTVLDGNPVLNGDDNNHNNVILNQLEKLSRGKDTTNANYAKVNNYDDFDVIVIAAGTNDANATDSPVNQFISGVSYIAVDNADVETMAGAMRTVVTSLKSLYPNAKIIICTPVQRATAPAERPFVNGEYIKETANRLGVRIVDSYTCGIYGADEVANAEGVYLIDGLHPNAEGAKILGNFNGHKIKEILQQGI